MQVVEVLVEPQSSPPRHFRCTCYRSCICQEHSLCTGTLRWVFPVSFLELSLLVTATELSNLSFPQLFCSFLTFDNLGCNFHTGFHTACYLSYKYFLTSTDLSMVDFKMLYSLGFCCTLSSSCLGKASSRNTLWYNCGTTRLMSF